METIHDRIRIARTAKGLSQTDLAELMGLRPQSIQQWEASTSPRRERLERLAEVLGVDTQWIQFGGDENPRFEPKEPNSDEYELIPQYTALGECGTGNMNDHVEVQGQLSFKKDWLAKVGLNAKNLSVIYAEGDSMYPTITDEAVVLIDHSQADTPREGKVYAIQRAGNGLVIKRLFRGQDGWVYRSDNPNRTIYPDLFPVEGDVIVARVVWQGGDGGL